LELDVVVNELVFGYSRLAPSLTVPTPPIYKLATTAAPAPARRFLTQPVFETALSLELQYHLLSASLITVFPERLRMRFGKEKQRVENGCCSQCARESFVRSAETESVVEQSWNSSKFVTSETMGSAKSFTAFFDSQQVSESSCPIELLPLLFEAETDLGDNTAHLNTKSKSLYLLKHFSFADSKALNAAESHISLRMKDLFFVDDSEKEKYENRLPAIELAQTNSQKEGLHKDQQTTKTLNTRNENFAFELRETLWSLETLGEAWRDARAKTRSREVTEEERKNDEEEMKTFFAEYENVLEGLEHSAPQEHWQRWINSSALESVLVLRRPLSVTYELLS
jgi:hypothetical protein